MAPPTEFEEFLPPDIKVSAMDQAIPKGNKAMYMMLADSATAGQMMNPPMDSAESGWELVEDLSAAGYVEDAKVHEPHYPHRYREEIQEMGPFIASIGFHSTFRDIFNPHPADNTFITHRHTIDTMAAPFKELSEYFDDQGNFIGEVGDSSVVSDSTVEDSGDSIDGDTSFNDEGVGLSTCVQSHFESVICLAAGLIVAFDNFSPSSLEGVDHVSDQMPCVKYWSDVSFLQLTMRTELKFDLKHILQYYVINKRTLAVVNEIIGKDLHVAWPGVTFDATSLQGQALIGTPNRNGMAYLLIQHKRKLGHKFISAITIFHPRGYGWMLLSHFTNVVNPQNVGQDITQQSEIDETVENLGGLAIE